MRLSVVVTIVDGGGTLRRCLGALGSQGDAPPLEILVPFDASVPGMDAIAAEFPDARFLPLGEVETERPADSISGQHELFDLRRSAGLRAAEGDLVAIVEDRGAPREDWARAAVKAHGRPDAVIGGAVENAGDGALARAVYLCDFGRYNTPLPEGPADYVTDVNVCYKRAALERTRSLWEERFHETTVHWELLRAGESLRLVPGMVVLQRREGLRFLSLLRERFVWGRLFAHTRARESTLGRRLLLALLSPLLPLVLLFRHAREQLAKRRDFGKFLRVSPLIFVFLCFWSAGEFVGYVTGRP